MDSRRFDRLTRLLAGAANRRALLVAGLVAASIPGVAAAACKQAGGACDRHTHCCDGRCVRKGRCRKHHRLTGRCRCGCVTHLDCDTHLCRDGACVQCAADGDCPSQQCGDGGVCSFPEVCPSDANACNAIVPCGQTEDGAGCACYQRVEGGSACIGERSDVVCASDEDCKPQIIFSVCVVDTPTSPICTGKGGLCGVPCPPPGNRAARPSS